MAVSGNWIDIAVQVYRVNWLCEKARKERWGEETELVMNEMDWTVNCFRHHEEIWKQRAEEAERPGQKAYAWRESSTWREWARIAEGTFKTLKAMEDSD